MNNVVYSDDTIKYSNGSYKKALDFVNDDMFEVAKELVVLLEERNFLSVNRKIEEIKVDKNLKANIVLILEKVMQVFFMKFKTDKTFQYKNIEKIEETIQRIRRNGNVDLALDSLMIDLCKI